jgi:hypothetical protein
MEKSIFDTVPLEQFVILSLILFCIGMIGVLRRRNMIVVFMSPLTGETLADKCLSFL